MRREEGYFRGFNDSELFYQSWMIENPKGIILITHGLGEHSECYQRLVEGLAPLSLNVYGWDLRGHGRSEGKRGVSHDFLDFCEDLKILLKQIKTRWANLPVFLLGHSMGGLICNRALLAFEDLKADGLILSSPLCRLAMKVPRFKRTGGKLLARWLPETTLKTQVSYKALTRDREVINEYKHDHLRHDKINPKLFFDFAQHCDYLLNNASQIQLPVLVLQAGQDRLVKKEATQSYFDNIASKDKTLKLYDGYYHEVFNDLGRDVVYTDVVDWMRPRLSH